jgi:hypothetical protein
MFVSLIRKNHWGQREVKSDKQEDFHCHQICTRKSFHFPTLNDILNHHIYHNLDGITDLLCLIPIKVMCVWNSSFPFHVGDNVFLLYGSSIKISSANCISVFIDDQHGHHHAISGSFKRSRSSFITMLEHLIPIKSSD